MAKTKELPIFEAYFEFASQTDMNTTTLTFRAANPVKARQSVVRWWNNRHEAWPEWFNTLCAVTIHRVTFGEILEDGTLDAMRRHCLAEWKLDHPVTLEKWAAAKK